MLKNTSANEINPLLYIPCNSLYGVTPRPTKAGVPVIGVNSRIMVAKRGVMSFTRLCKDTQLTVDFANVPAEYWYTQVGSTKKYKVNKEVLRTETYNPTPSWVK